MRYLLFSIVLIALSVSACKQNASEKRSPEIQFSNTQRVVMLDSAAAANAIVRDAIDHFFEQITPIDVALQTHSNAPLSMRRDSMLKMYRAYLETDVASFTAEEQAFMSKVFADVYSIFLNIAPKYYPDEVKIIKTKGNHYGDEAYYTRENMIVVPAAALKNPNYDEFLRTMLHEMSHLITRLNPQMKAKLYALIGFKKMETPLSIPDSLSSRLLINPDGCDRNWATELTAADGKTVYATPLIYAKTDKTDPKKGLFDQMGFAYYEILPSADNKKLQVATRAPRQQSTLDNSNLSKLFTEKFNTAYIIHPDEIIAENFAHLAIDSRPATNGKTPQKGKYTEGGTILLEKMKTALAQ